MKLTLECAPHFSDNISNFRVDDARTFKTSQFKVKAMFNHLIPITLSEKEIITSSIEPPSPIQHLRRGAPFFNLPRGAKTLSSVCTPGVCHPGYATDTGQSLLSCKFSSNLIGFLQATAEMTWWYWLELLTGHVSIGKEYWSVIGSRHVKVGNAGPRDCSRRVSPNVPRLTSDQSTTPINTTNSSLQLPEEIQWDWMKICKKAIFVQYLVYNSNLILQLDDW